MKTKVLFVGWRDHFAQPGWSNLDDVATTSKGKYVESVGFLIHEDEDCIVLAKSQCDENQTVAHTTTILKKLVEKRRVLWTK
jgi:hypothetical protein